MPGPNKTAPLAAEFTRPFLERHFNPEVVAALYEHMPRYTRGKNKGKPKGYAAWIKCTFGGWYRDGAFGYGFVMKPGTNLVKGPARPRRWEWSRATAATRRLRTGRLYSGAFGELDGDTLYMG